MKILDFKVAKTKISSNAAWLLLLVVLFMAAAAPVYRLRNLEKAPDAGYVITSTTGGLATWALSGNGEINVNPTPINYTPTVTGNATNLNEVVTDPSGRVWVIDQNGDAVRTSGAAAATPTAAEIDYDDSSTGLGDNVAAALDSLANRSSMGGGSGTTSYRVGNTDIIYTGDASATPVTYVLNAAGDLTFTIPDGVLRFSLNVPQSVIGQSAGNTATCTFNFPAGVVFNQSENTMRYPSAHIYSRATEGSNGFDVEMRGNNPQSRLLPFVTAGRCAHQFGGVNTAGSTWSLTYNF